MSEAKGVLATGRLLARSGKLATAAGVAVAAWAGLLPAGLIAQDQCQVRDERRLTGDATGEVSIDTGVGKLIVVGRKDADGISVVATLCASSQDRLDELRVTLDESGGRSRIDTDYPNPARELEREELRPHRSGRRGARWNERRRGRPLGKRMLSGVGRSTCGTVRAG